MFAEDEAALLLAAARTDAELGTLLRRRCGGEPLEQVVGWAEFCGLRISLVPGVFVPRQRTAALVRAAVAPLVRAAVAAAAAPESVVLDLCCGSGAVGAAVASALRHAGRRYELFAADIDAAAVRCARANLDGVGTVFGGDLFAALPLALCGRVDVLVVNAPYVPTDEVAFLPPEARLHEPRQALDGGADGLDVHRRVAADAVSWLAPGGRLLIETSRAQAPVAAALLRAGGLRSSVQHDEEWDCTVVSGRRP